jgi:hypothetical protein
MNQYCTDVIETGWNTTLILVSYPETIVDNYCLKNSELGINWLEKPIITKNSKFKDKH